MEEKEFKECKLYTVEEACINSFHVFHYLVTSDTRTIDDIHIVEWEDNEHGLNHKLFDSAENAEKEFNARCKKLLK